MEGIKYPPEGRRNEDITWTELERAQATGRILEATAALCGRDHELYIELPGGVQGVIPRGEAALGADRGLVRDIAVITRVGKPVCFKVLELSRAGGSPTGMPRALLSRRLAQEECAAEYVSRLRPGDVIPARVTHLEPFGAFVDIGCGVVSLIPIDSISVSRISHPRDRFFVGQDIRAVVKAVDSDGRLLLSHRELLGTWEENAARFAAGQTAAGIVRSVEDYGVFVELTPNLAGLAEWKDGVRFGQSAAVYIKSILPQKMKVKLVIVSSFDAQTPPRPPEYRITSGHIGVWRYSPEVCDRTIETAFD